MTHLTLMTMPYWLRVVTVLLNSVGFACAGWVSVHRE
jgi:hypothetical protein